MQKISKILFVFGFLILLFFPFAKASGHELLPKQVVEFLKQNPNATPEQIQEFVSQVSPELAQKYENTEQLVSGIKGSQNVGFFGNAWLFIQAGFNHILSGPDHILFVLSLLLVFISMRAVFKLTFAFTIAHSLTLILAGASILTISSKIVEPIIALSISFVAITSVYFKKYGFAELNKKLPVVFLFGLFHGLGFAGLLRDVQIPEGRFVSSLLFFNVGIELGQIFIILLVLPAIYYFKDKDWYSKLITALAVIMAIIGLFWAFQRVLG